MSYDSLMVFTGNANPNLAADVVKRLHISLGRANVGRFSDGEVNVEILEHVRGQDVFILQSTCQPTNDNLMELMVMVDALKRASAGRITAAIYAAPILLGDIWKQQHENLLVVSPDVGGVVRARALAKRLDSDLAIIDKRRPKANVSEVMNIIGDVAGRTCVIMDDMVDTAGTLCKASQALKEQGATKVLAYCTHAVLSGSAVARIAESEIDELVVTDTIPLSPEAVACRRIRQISIAELMAETMLRISNEASVSSLFMD